MSQVNQVARTVQWFQKAKPMPSTDDIRVQAGCHFEEVGEMLAEMQGLCPTSQRAIQQARRAVNNLAGLLKDGVANFMVKNDVAYLDSLFDQYTTAIGVGHTMGYDMTAAISEGNRSNFSKFDEKGDPIFHPNGKIAKSHLYVMPNFEPYVL